MADKEVRALLRCIATGEERWHSYSVAPEYADNQLFWWTEGNAECDCNRHLFFERSVEPGYDGDAACGEIAYQLVRLEMDGQSLLTPPPP